MSTITNGEIQKGEVSGGISRGYTLLRKGATSVRIYTQGSTNTVWYATDQDDVPVTAIRPHHEMLSKIDTLHDQRGGSPFHGIFMPRPQEGLIAQPGPVYIHGSWAGLPWEIYNKNEQDASVTMLLRADFFFFFLVAYYSRASKRNASDEEIGAYRRMRQAVKNRYPHDGNVANLIKQTDKSINDIQIRQLLGLLYPGEVSVLRTVQISEPYGDGIVFVDDTATLINVSQDTTASHAAGFHTYWNASLDQLRIPARSLLKRRALYPGYDENLENVEARVIFQRDEFGRMIVAVPLFELARPTTNQVIYHDHEGRTSPRHEVALENNTQRGELYPSVGTEIKPEGESVIGFRTIIVDLNKVSASDFAILQGYIDTVQQQLGADPLDLYALFS